jgi:hypothetical protein
VAGTRGGGADAGVRAGLRTGEAVVRVQPVLLLRRELGVLGQRRGGRDELRVVGDDDVVAAELGLRERHEGVAAAGALDGGERGVAVAAVGVELVDGAERLVAAAHHRAALELLCLVDREHGVPLVSGGSVVAARWRDQRVCPG